MLNRRRLSDFRLANGDGREHPFREFLADLNILAFRRVPVPSHGPATRLLQQLLDEYRGVEEASVRAFDIRSPDRPCEACQAPHIVFTGTDIATICDGDGSIFRMFGAVGYDRIFVVRSVPQVIDVGSIEEIACVSARGGSSDPSHDHIARAPPEHRHPRRRDAAA